MSHDEAKRRVLARRARFMAAAGIAGAALSASTPAHADDASIDGGDVPDGAIFVEAGVRSDGGDDDGDLVDGAPPTPCLSMKKPEPQPCLSSCAATTRASSAPIVPAIVAVGAAMGALRRRKKTKTTR